MADSLYIANLEKDSGKLLVSLGLLELLSRRIGRVGFFRPITPGDERDDDLKLIRSRYAIPLADEEMTGVSHDQARALIAAGEELRLFRHGRDFMIVLGHNELICALKSVHTMPLKSCRGVSKS